MPDVRNIRNLVVEVAHGVCDYLLEHKDDDTESQILIATLYGIVAFNTGVEKVPPFDHRSLTKCNNNSKFCRSLTMTLS